MGGTAHLCQSEKSGKGPVRTPQPCNYYTGWFVTVGLLLLRSTVGMLGTVRRFDFLLPIVPASK